MSILAKIFGDPNERVLRKLKPVVDEINQLEVEIQKLSDEALKAETGKFRQGLKSGKALDDILPRALAVAREAIRRKIGERAYDVQLVAAIVLHQGKIAEQKTGEGKTLSAALAAYLNALAGRGVHIVTVNDYLARRDTGWYGRALEALGLKVACLVHEQAFLLDPSYVEENQTDERLRHLKPCARRDAYQADITYGTNNEFGFDYLRDNMVMSLEQMAQRPFYFAIVDEVDSILIDEARTPLIISAPAEESAELYYKFAGLVRSLKENVDYNIDEKMRAATLTEDGISKMEKALGVDNIYTSGGITLVHHIEQALRAETLFKRDRDYVVKEGEVIIVDEFTGRLMFGRRYSEGLHQAIEAKEGVEIKRESQTLATITFQNYFRLYEKLAGMTGTAVTEAEEFHKIYKLEVVVIPTNKPMIRKDLPDRIYKNEEGKFKAVVQEIKARHEKGQPVLVGTISIEKNELLGQLLGREGIPYEILNAKHHEKEAKILAQAGRTGAVTVATNMAGRGVDIVLGGERPKQEKGEVEDWKKEHDKVVASGGEHVIGTERHEARRIDNQLRGRSGRQGDPGSSQFYVSMDDDLMRIFGSERMQRIMETLKVPADLPIENKLVSKSIEAAQKKVEGHNFDIRKHLVEYDDVMNKHREVIYRKRCQILELDRREPLVETDTNLRNKILEMVEAELEQVVLFHTASEDEKKWDIQEIYEVANTIFPVSKEARIKMADIENREAGNKAQDAQARTKIIQYLVELARQAYEDLEKKINEGLANVRAMREIEKGIILRTIDTLWVEHLNAMDHLRTGIGLRGYGQRDPLVEYKKEAYRLFTELMNLIQRQVVYSIYKVGLVRALAPSLVQRGGLELSASAKTLEKGKGQFVGARLVKPSEKAVQEEVIPSRARDAQGRKIGRNDPCPCGSGKKYKRCHGK